MMFAYFAGGCFWCITPTLKSIKGVRSVTSGYSGGAEADPTYADVKAQKTGHRETVRVEFDPEKVSFAELLEVFLGDVDVTDGGGQFIDRGHSYTLAVYYADEEQKRITEARLTQYEQPVFVAVEPFTAFYRAEEYHQDYYRKNPEAFAKELVESGRAARGEKAGEGKAKKMSKVDYEELCDSLAAATDGVGNLISNLANASALIWEYLPDINWAGFYQMIGGHLELGPFQGKAACTEIEVGKGVCGTAVLKDAVQVVKDVHTFDGHIACDSASNSEIVLPMHKNGAVWGVLDIDSTRFDRFSKDDESGLLRVVGVLETIL